MANNTDDDVCFFSRKLSGAQARLFAHGCTHYSQAAEDACNDDPGEHPLFCWLSTHQRLALVADVAVGLLCPDEPLPPQTIQHYAAYLGVFACINTELEIEMDDIYNREVGEDFIDEFNEKYPIQERGRRRTDEEQEERNISLALIAKAADKNKTKMDNRKDGNNENFVAEKTERDGTELQEEMQRLSEIFSSSPCTDEDRRPPRPLTKSEKSFGFHWRLLCDAAFQEDTVCDFVMPPLCMVSFCWKSYDVRKWHIAVQHLMISKTRMVGFSGRDISETENALLYGQIDDFAYADRSQHARIRAVKKLVKELRDSYDPAWDPAKLAEDQRLIYSLCSGEFYAGMSHKEFATSFAHKCLDRGFDLTDVEKDSAAGHYQERLEIFRSMQKEDNFVEGLDKPYHDSYEGATLGDWKAPIDFKPLDGLLFGGSCGYSNCYFDHMKFDPSFSKYHKDDDQEEDKGDRQKFQDQDTGENVLKYCSRCLVVRYCSRYCQRKDWPSHKKMCKTLADFRKDKDKLQEAVKKF